MRKCSGETREGITRMDKSKWECVTCTETREEIERNQNRDQGERKEMNYIQSGKANNGTQIPSCRKGGVQTST